jgi:serine/threonine protein kinase
MAGTSPVNATGSGKVTTHTPDGMYKFELGSLGALGAGAHGVVRVARHVVTGEMVAVKVMAATRLGAIAKELAANGRLRHPHIVELKATLVDLDRKRVFMVMELCRGGELFDRIAECGSLDEGSAKRYLYQITSALAHCHAASVYHRDLKPENILLTADGWVKVCDFGLAATLRQVHEDASFLRHTKCGSIMYAAPEVLTATELLGYAAAPADVWSLGVILYAMLTGALPFACANAERCSRFAIAVQHGMRPACEANHLSEQATQMLCGMLQIDPAKRMSVGEVLSSEWLAAERTEAETTPPPCPSKWSLLGDSGPAPGNGGWQRKVDAQSPAKRPASSGADREANNRKRLNGAANHVNGCREDPAVTAGMTASGGTAVAATGAASDSTLGVNAMLVRSLGWVQLPADKEQMVQDVRTTLAELGASFSVVSGELSDVLRARLGESLPGGDAANGCPASATRRGSPAAPSVDAGVEGGAEPGIVRDPLDAALSDSLPADDDGVGVAEGRLTVRIQIVANGGDSSDIHFSREEGSILQFHSFYRDVRAQLAGANGWSETEGRYHCDAGQFTPHGDEP